LETKSQFFTHYQQFTSNFKSNITDEQIFLKWSNLLYQVDHTKIREIRAQLYAKYGFRMETRENERRLVKQLFIYFFVFF
jgi:hypothetical protein